MGHFKFEMSGRHPIETAVNLLNFPEVCPLEFLFIMWVSGRQTYSHIHIFCIFVFLCTILGVFPIKLSSKLLIL